MERMIGYEPIGGSSILSESIICGCGGIGRREGLKIPFREECEFKSRQPHLAGVAE